MNIVGWSKKFKEYERMDVLVHVKKTEKIFWFSMLFGIILVIAGIFVILKTFQHGVIGFVFMLAGVVIISLASIWAYIRLAICEIIQEMRLMSDNNS